MRRFHASSGCSFGGVAADEQDGRGGGRVAQTAAVAVMAGEGAGKGGVVGGAVVVDVVGAENRARKLLQQVVLFVGGAVGADDADRRCRPCVSRISLSLPAAKRSASSQVAGSSLPAALRTSGLVRRSVFSTKSKP